MFNLKDIMVLALTAAALHFILLCGEKLAPAPLAGLAVTLVLFAQLRFYVPVLLLFPVKLVGLWFLARGYWLGAMATLVGAKIVSTGVTAFIFELTRPKLLQLAWFRWLHDHVVVWLAWAHGLIDPLKHEVRRWARETLAPLRRRLRKWFWLMKPQRRGRFIRRLMHIRRRVQQA